MSKTMLPFLNSKQKKTVDTGSSVVLDSKGPKKSNDGKIVDHGNLGDLSYEIFERGVIHIFDKSLKFKKDIYAFEGEVKGHDFQIMQDGDCFTIFGSGDNDHITFNKENGDFKISLRKRDFEAIGLLQSIIKKGKQKLTGGA